MGTENKMIFNEKILLIGGGGHCRSCIEVIESVKRFKIYGIIDLKENIGKNVLNYPIISDDSKLEDMLKLCNNVLITIGYVNSNIRRIVLYETLLSLGAKFPVIKASTAYISKKTHIKQGTIVMHKAFINSDVEIGFNCIINTNALIEHDVIIGNNTHVSTGAIINGGCNIGDNCLIGSGSVVRNGVNICSDVIIGGGTVVIDDIVESGIYVGVPARRIK